MHEGNDTAAILACGYTGSETSHYIRFTAWVARRQKKRIDTYVIQHKHVGAYGLYDDIEERVQTLSPHY